MKLAVTSLLLQRTCTGAIIFCDACATASHVGSAFATSDRPSNNANSSARAK